jgi:hypothetical protein
VVSTLAPELASAMGGHKALNATQDMDMASLDTEDQVREEFAQSIEKHSFTSVWQQQGGKGPVQAQASVMRGMLIEKSQVSSEKQQFQLLI